MFTRILLITQSILLLIFFVTVQVDASDEFKSKSIRTCWDLVSPKPSRDQEVPSLTIYKVLLTPLHLRSPEDLDHVRQFKNQELIPMALGKKTRFVKTVDLKDPSLTKTSETLAKYQKTIPLFAPEARSNLTRYDEAILDLRAGDRIVYHNETILLGEYLDADEKCHLYEFAGDPNWVVRIPFSYTGDGLKARQSALEYEANMARLPSEIPRVEVKPGPEGAFTLVSRIHGDEDGKTFLNTNGSLTTPRQQKKKRLIILVDQALKSDAIRRQTGHMIRIDAAQYFIWDNIKQDWILSGF